MSGLLTLYRLLTGVATPGLACLLAARARKGKEDPARIGERMGTPSMPRPGGFLVWIHAASVGEAQAALIVVDYILARRPDIHILVTSGTVTSAALMKSRLPPPALHQFAPVDEPRWVDAFLDHWQPDLAMWMESELWPNLVAATGRRAIPSFLVNARLSDRSYRRWKMAPRAAALLLGNFSAILAQTGTDCDRFAALGGRRVLATGNIKFSASPLPCDELALSGLRLTIAGRPAWVYASTHDGEEELACRVHRRLKGTMPSLLTIIVPRHPERRDAIAGTCFENGLKYRLRSHNHALPAADDDIYIADTLGELGLFYRLCDVAMIGRSFSRDGGGGHNPVEAAQLGCAVATGPNNQFQRSLYDEMLRDEAVAVARDEEELAAIIESLLTDQNRLEAARQRSAAFAATRARVIEETMAEIMPLIPEGEDADAA